MDWTNTLYFGDNLKVLRDNIASESVDLIYLDPPFNSNANYNVLFKEKSGEESAAQIHAFEDTWGWGIESEAAYNELVTQGPKKLADLMQALLSFLGRNDMMAYLVMMAIRLVELHRVLKASGSIYLHCDPTSSHYLKLELDAVFSPWNFLNEIVWKRTSAHSDTKQGRRAFGNITDILLFCTKTEEYTFNPQHQAYDEKHLKKYQNVDPDERRYTLSDLTGPGGAAKGNPSYAVMGVTKYWRFSKERMAQLIREGRVIQPSPGASEALSR